MEFGENLSDEENDLGYSLPAGATGGGMDFNDSDEDFDEEDELGSYCLICHCA